MFIEFSLATAAGLMGCVIWRKLVHYHLVPKNFGTLEPGHVYRSARLTPNALRIVHRRTGIRTVIDLSGGSRPERRQGEFQTIEELAIRRHAFHGLGGTGWHGDPAVFAQALALVADPANHPVLFHCAAGANRTSTLAALYAHLFQGMDLERAAANCRPFRCNLFRRPDHMDYIANAVPVVRTLLEEEARAARLAIALPWLAGPLSPVLGTRPRPAGALPLRCPVLAG